MIPILDRILRPGGRVARTLARFRERTELFFHSRRENTSRASARSEALNRKEIEAERIDRLRNPSDYRCR
jgi:hypothetical protein